MPPTDSVPLNNLGRSILSLRRDQVHSMENSHDSLGQEMELDSFQKRVADRFADLAAIGGGDDLLSIGWVRKLLDCFLLCYEEFRVILLNYKLQVMKGPTDRLVSEFHDRSVKALDVCNAIRDGIEQIRQWQKLLDIVLCALDSDRSIGEGQFRRAKKALIDLAIAMLDEKDSSGTIAHRNRSFGRNSVSKDQNRLGHFRSLSWSVSRSWSAARQLQAIGNNLNAPRGNEIAATSGLAVPIYTMGSVLLIVMWALVAAIPCQDRGLHIHFTVPRQQYGWAGPMLLIHERILEESKKRDRRNAFGLLKEIYQIEKWARMMNELGDSIQFPLSDEKEGEVRQKVQELAQICEAIKVGVDPLERQVREVFHKIVRSRTESLDSMGKTNHPE